MTAKQHDDQATPLKAQRPGLLLGGLFVGFASMSLTVGTFWVFAAVFPAVVAAVAALIPVRGHWQFVFGSLAAAFGGAVFSAVFAILISLA